jgi:hypothetical protein
MKELILILFVSSSLWLVAWGLLSRHGHYQYVFLAGAVFAGWIAPQAVGLYSSYSLPEGGYERTLFMATLCTAAIYLGNVSSIKPWRSFAWNLDDKRLLIGAATLSAFGGFFAYLLGSLPEEMKDAQMTGIGTIYYFFAQTQNYGYAIAAIQYARTRRPLALALVFIDLAFFAPAILVGARRGVAIEIGMITLLAFWFGRGWVISRALMVAAVIVGMMLVFSTGQLRQSASSSARSDQALTHLPTLDELSKIDFTANFDDILSKGSFELTNAIYYMAATAASESYNFGESYWNAFVFRYVPGQFFGKDLKTSLMFDVPDDNHAERIYGYKTVLGSTPTGLSDSYAAFWFFGAGVFFLISRIMARLYMAAVRQHRVAQILYMASITDALQAITHVSWWFFTPWVHYVLFLGPLFVWARVKINPAQRVASSAFTREAIGPSAGNT